MSKKKFKLKANEIKGLGNVLKVKQHKKISIKRWLTLNCA